MPNRSTGSARSAAMALVAAAGLALVASHTRAQGDPLERPFPAVLELSDLDGVIGFRLDGIAAGDLSGRCVAGAGDVNGDGLDDLIIGASRAGPDGRGFAGESYIVFGRTAGDGFPAVTILDELDGTNGVRLWGQQEDQSGTAVAAAGDVNGDGVGDVAIGAPWATIFAGGYERNYAGRTYIVYGRAGAGGGGGLPAVVDLGALDGTDGVRIEGTITVGFSGWRLASVGDANGDGLGDVIIGAANAQPPGGIWSGVAYVVFGAMGATPLPPLLRLDELDGANGFRLDGVADEDRCGDAVGPAGDINGDGLADVAIGASWADPGGQYRAGQSYVIYGRDAAAGAGFPAVFPLSGVDGANGFAFDGGRTLDTSGQGVSGVGDVNGDGIDDVAIGAIGARAGGADPEDRYTGETYVVFGRRGAGAIPARLDPTMLDGSNGFRIDGVAPGDRSGGSVACAGDVNGDGVDDLIIGAYYARPGGRTDAGQSAVVFGRAGEGGFPPVVRLGELDGTNGFLINGIGAGDLSGLVVAGAGDANGDGVDDLVIGAFRADPGGRAEAGSSYVVFGRRTCRADLDGDGLLTLFDYLAFGTLFATMDPRADFDRDGAFTLMDFLAFQNAFDLGCP